MKSKTVIKTSIFPADKDVIWDTLQYLKTLQYIAAPYASFHSTDENADLRGNREKPSGFILNYLESFPLELTK